MNTYDSTIDERENTSVIFAIVIGIHSKAIGISRGSSFVILGHMCRIRVRVYNMVSMPLRLMNGTKYVIEFRINTSSLKFRSQL